MNIAFKGISGITIAQSIEQQNLKQKVILRVNNENTPDLDEVTKSFKNFPTKDNSKDLLSLDLISSKMPNGKVVGSFYLNNHPLNLSDETLPLFIKLNKLLNNAENIGTIKITQGTKLVDNILEGMRRYNVLLDVNNGLKKALTNFLR